MGVAEIQFGVIAADIALAGGPGESGTGGGAGGREVVTGPLFGLEAFQDSMDSASAGF